MSGQSEESRVYNRPMNESERKSIRQVYKNAQKQARPASVFALVLAAVGFVTGAGNFDFSTPGGMTSVLILVVGLGAFVYAGSLSRLRRSVSSSLDEGNVVIVRARASRFNGRMNTSALVVGPLSLNLGKTEANLVQEGSTTEVACVPKLKAAVSFNGAGLDRPIKIMVPVDLEAKASIGTPAGPGQSYNAYAPIPAPGSMAMEFCHSCGTPAKGMVFCSNCGSKL
jgi:hypothetical protein